MFEHKIREVEMFREGNQEANGLQLRITPRRRFYGFPLFSFAARIAAIALAQNVALGAQALFVQGDYEWRLLGTDGAVKWRVDYQFEVTISDRGWRMGLSPLQPNTAAKSSAGSDNQDTYQLTDNAHLAAATATISGRVVTNSLTQFGSVCKGPFPSEGAKELQVLWVGFLYAIERTNMPSARLIKLGGMDYHVSRDAEFKTRFDGDNVLKSAEYFSVGEVILAGKKVQLQPPLDQGYALWTLNAGDHTNTPVASIPLKFSFDQYLPINASTLLHQWSSSAMVKHLKLVSLDSEQHDLLPSFTNKSIVVFDSRFSEIGGRSASGERVPVTMYYVSNGRWLNRTEAESYNNGHVRVTANSSPPIISGNRLWTFRILCALSAVSFLLLAWKLKTSKQTT